ncbi:MAG: MATE family efflux transporter [Anaeroplasmataceae bacterium]
MNKELKKREQILNGNLWKTTLIIALPILFYNLCNYLYGIYDMMIVEKANIGSAADIVVLDQIMNMLSTIGGALATAGGILVSRRYGADDINGAKRCANVLFTLALIVAGVTLLFIPIGVPFLKVLKTDETTISGAMGYYYSQIIILFIITINEVFISIEKAKGNTLIILILNLAVIFLKIGLTTLFAFGPFENVTVTWLGMATIIAQGFMLLVGLILLFNRKNILRIEFKSIRLNKIDSFSIIRLALPVFLGRFLFCFGKVYVNSQALVAYGKTCVGALGISNTIAGLLSNMINSFEDAGGTIVSQNYGACNGRRIYKFFFINFIYIIVMSIIGTIVLYVLKEPIAKFFADDDLIYKDMIVNIFKWECLDICFMGLNGIAMSIFYGFGMTKITMSLSMATLFAFRIPILLMLMKVIKMNYEACGVAMFISNVLTGIISITICIGFLILMKKKDKYSYLFKNNDTLIVLK